MSNNATKESAYKNWLLTIAGLLIVGLLSWIGVSNLQSLAFQSAIQPQIATLVTDAKETKENVNDIKVQLTGFATKTDLANEVRRLETRIQEMELELVRICTLASLPECNRGN